MCECRVGSCPDYTKLQSTVTDRQTDRQTD